MDQRIERGEQTRKRLVSVASKLFGEHGYEATPIELVLERAAISKGALYHHFGNKRQLYEAVLEAIEADLARATVEAAGKATDPVEGLRAGSRAFLSLVGDPAIGRIVLTDAPTVLGWARWREIDERHAFGVLKAAVAVTPATKRLSQDELDALAHVLLAALIELAMIVARSDSPSEAQDIAQTIMDELLNRLLGS
jgi:AcrR family transcriptional regulator